MLSRFSRIVLKLFGWSVEYTDPQTSRYVLIGAPHTSNWDFPLALLAMSSVGLRFNWVAKHTLFRWPLGVLFRRIGGIPVDRSSGTGFLKSVIREFRTRDQFILAISPEGTRSWTRGWKTGFYLVACKARVPIIMGYIDYPSKRIGITGRLEPSGELSRDFPRIQEYYRNRRGKFPNQQGVVRILSRK